MSDSIWHKASEKPELNKYVVVRKHGFAQWKVFKFDNKTTFYEPFTDDLWAYVDDLIAQADKAERLQKRLDAIFNIIDKSRCQDVFAISNNDAWDVWGTAKGLKTDNEIKQLIKVE